MANLCENKGRYSNWRFDYVYIYIYIYFNFSQHLGTTGIIEAGNLTHYCSTQKIQRLPHTLLIL